MEPTDLISFAKANLEPMSLPRGGTGYRCAATLSDGVRLPCVLLASLEPYLDLAVRRFDETLADGQKPEGKRKFGYGMQYRDIVETFVAKGNRLSYADIASLAVSPFALPLARLQEVGGETRMSWTQFTAVMRDGREFGFATTYLTEFFDMPEGYSGSDVVSIIPHKLHQGVHPHRERSFFTCYVPGL